MINLSFMKTKINKALFLSIFLMLPVPIFTSEIVELNNKRNFPNHLKNLSWSSILAFVCLFDWVLSIGSEGSWLPY